MVLVVKNLAASPGDTRDSSSIPGSGRSPGVGNGNSLWYPCLEISMGRGAWQAAVHRATESDMTERLSTKYIRYVFNVRMFYYASNMFSGLPWWLGWQRIYLQCQRLWFDPWVRMIPWRREWFTHSSILTWSIPWIMLKILKI